MALSFKSNWLINYVRESREELRHVTWPTRQQVIRDTVVVVAACVALGVFFGIADFGLTKGLQQILTLK